MPFLKRLAAKINHYLIAEEVRTISRIEVLQPTDTFVTEVLTFLHGQQRKNDLYTEIDSTTLYGIEFRRGYILQWKEQPQTVQAA